MTTAEKLAQLDAHSARVLRCGGPKAVEKQHALGKRTAVNGLKLVDGYRHFYRGGTAGAPPLYPPGMGDKGHPGRRRGYRLRKIGTGARFLYTLRDFTARGGSLGEMHAAKIRKIMDMALEAAALWWACATSGGARIQGGGDALSGYGRFSTATPALPDVSRRSPPSWVPARAARSTPPP